jgi:hypothetical protein
MALPAWVAERNATDALVPLAIWLLLTWTKDGGAEEAAVVVAESGAQRGETLFDVSYAATA